jgi:hypothetical protein
MSAGRLRDSSAGPGSNPGRRITEIPAKLYCIKDPDAVAETIRKTAREARKRHGVVTQEPF